MGKDIVEMGDYLLRTFDIAWVLRAMTDDATRTPLWWMHVEEGGVFICTDGRRLHKLTEPDLADMFDLGNYKVIKQTKKLIIFQKVPPEQGEYPDWKQVVPEPIPFNDGKVINWEDPTEEWLFFACADLASMGVQGFNTRYLQDALTYGENTLKAIDEYSPVEVISGNRYAIIMPLRRS